MDAVRCWAHGSRGDPREGRSLRLGQESAAEALYRSPTQVGRKTEKARIARCLAKLTRVMGIVRHRRLAEQAAEINQILRGHYAYYGMGGNLRSLHRLHRACERCWRRILSSRSQRGKLTWEKFYLKLAPEGRCDPRRSQARAWRPAPVRRFSTA
jgi:hypothetical protein